MYRLLPRGDVGRRVLLFVLVIGGLIATALATAWVGSAQGTYVGQVEVVVHPATSQTAGNPLAYSSDAVVQFAALIAEVATNGEERPRVTSQNLTLADQGMRHDTFISLVNLGGQWANDFSRPFIRIEAVDSSPEAVTVRLEDGIAQVTRTMERMQDEADVPPATRTTAEAVPAVPQVRYEPTHRGRAMLMTALVGLLLTVAACRHSARRLRVSARGETVVPTEPRAAQLALSISSGGPHDRSSYLGGQGEPHTI